MDNCSCCMPKLNSGPELFDSVGEYRDRKVVDETIGSVDISLPSPPSVSFFSPPPPPPPSVSFFSPSPLPLLSVQGWATIWAGSSLTLCKSIVIARWWMKLLVSRYLSLPILSDCFIPSFLPLSLSPLSLVLPLSLSTIPLSLFLKGWATILAGSPLTLCKSLVIAKRWTTLLTLHGPFYTVHREHRKVHEQS